MEIGSYITGFVDGEGSFLVSFSKRDRMASGIEVRPAFTVSQHKRNKNILLKSKNISVAEQFVSIRAMIRGNTKCAV